MNWEFHPAARQELDESAGWYERRKPGLGHEFLAEVQKTVERILANPERWRKIHAEARCCLMARFPFTIIYRLRKHRVEIIAVKHHSRRPAYWKRRLR